jgi:hypothetical protein
MNKKELAEMIKHLRKMKMEQTGGMGKFKGGAVDLQDLSSPNRPVGASSKEQHHVKEARNPMTRGGAQGKGHLGGSRLASRFAQQKARGNQNMGGRNLTGPPKITEAEKDIGDTMTSKKGKRRETINLEPKQSDEKIF